MTFKPRLFRICLIAAFIMLGGCEKDNYTTWNCSSTTESKISMVLRKAQMELKESKWNYCGSLGNQSYFDQKCPAQIAQSQIVFTPSSGTLILNQQEFQCKVL